MNSNNLDGWRSFSVAFLIERQEEEKDAVACKLLPDVVTKSLQNARMLKGCYPAFSVLQPAPAEKYMTWGHKAFDDNDTFATWLIDQSRVHNIPTARTFVSCNLLLKKTGRWPEAKLKDVDDMEARSNKRGTKYKYRLKNGAKLLGCIDSLFDLDVLFKAPKPEPSFKLLRKYLDEVETDPDIWNWIGNDRKETFGLPLRLRSKMKSIASAFSECQSELNASMLLAQFIRKFTVASDTKLLTNSEGMFSLRNMLWSEEVEFISDDFRKCMTEPLVEAQRAWFEAVEAVLAVAGEVVPARMTEKKRKQLSRRVRKIRTIFLLKQGVNSCKVANAACGRVDNNCHSILSTQPKN
ncbi:hypothetical protein PsorP6_007593 [Peronosclerospora sorghi]|uniref:Uncharacterized protein n=1 Tax=Peronosclerospora sorghi TaxID=230839 RepID=A0ACC0WBC6_9STRA|nr:hypothetical protein PsorP6_007593 [Peronosclerospora sorghi]